MKHYDRVSTSSQGSRVMARDPQTRHYTGADELTERVQKMAHERQERTITVPKPKLRLQILRGSQVLDEQELLEYSEVVIHTQPDKVRITPSVSRVVSLK